MAQYFWEVIFIWTEFQPRPMVTGKEAGWFRLFFFFFQFLLSSSFKYFELKIPTLEDLLFIRNFPILSMSSSKAHQNFLFIFMLETRIEWDHVFCFCHNLCTSTVNNCTVTLRLVHCPVFRVQFWNYKCMCEICFRYLR